MSDFFLCREFRKSAGNAGSSYCRNVGETLFHLWNPTLLRHRSRSKRLPDDVCKRIYIPQERKWPICVRSAKQDSGSHSRSRSGVCAVDCFVIRKSNPSPKSLRVPDGRVDDTPHLCFIDTDSRSIRESHLWVPFGPER